MALVNARKITELSQIDQSCFITYFWQHTSTPRSEYPLKTSRELLKEKLSEKSQK